MLVALPFHHFCHDLILVVFRVHLELVLRAFSQCRLLDRGGARTEAILTSFRPVGDRRRLRGSCRRRGLDLVLTGPPLLDEGQELGLARDVFAQDLGDDEALGGLIVFEDAAERAFGGAN